MSPSMSPVVSEDKLGAAVLGTGDVSGEHIKAYQQNPYTEVRALLGRDRARAEAKAAQYNLVGCRASRLPGPAIREQLVIIHFAVEEVAHRALVQVSPIHYSGKKTIASAFK